jgi:hypothetical protein
MMMAIQIILTEVGFFCLGYGVAILFYEEFVWATVCLSIAFLSILFGVR